MSWPQVNIMKSIIVLAVLSLAICASSQGTFDVDTDRPGTDIPGWRTANSPQDCQSQCRNTPNCKVWIYDSCGGPNAACWMKSEVNTGIMAKCRTSGVLDPRTSFRNPILPDKMADPWMLQVGDWYYLTATTGGDISLWRSRDLTNFYGAERRSIWAPDRAGSNLKDLWAPEIHFIDGRLYCYFAADTDTQLNDHKMYVLVNNGSDPFGDWSFAGKINTNDDNWAIDGTVWNQGNGNLYFIWSGWENNILNFLQNLYIAKMCTGDPTKLCSPRTLLHRPLQNWMRDGKSGVNEGPQILLNGNRTFLIYSASSSWSSKYCLGMMGINSGDGDPLNAKNWWKFDDAPVMKGDNGVYGPGHCSFVKDRTGTDWIVYHANDLDLRGDIAWYSRTIRAESFRWNGDGSPWLPTPPRNIYQDINAPPLF
ncbi:glycoside hydrolase family 43 protein [Planoprotostelium fungivorum]|uniref:Glycoside hydrolase family 43 protein n=1 Tax=Planoprotostelium fungivorum TaxID=1890364 RepID=A0A2P6NWD1_9EUKA|nr:glycoside hydrolase family 43 protein [Planoprotostelium fungivorum]